MAGKTKPVLVKDKYVWWNRPEKRRIWGQIAIAKGGKCWVRFPSGGGHVFLWCPNTELELMTHGNTFATKG